MSKPSPAERELRARAMANARWSRATPAERSAAARTARAGYIARFERQVDPDGTLDPQERTRRAEMARRAHEDENRAKALAAKRRNADARRAAAAKARQDGGAA